MWPLITEVDDLSIYFPDYKPNQLPERRFMFSILATFRQNELSSMIKNARDNRAIQKPENDNRLVHIEKKFYNEIQGIMTRKCKTLQLLKYLVTKGRASHLLRRSANLQAVRKPAKEFELAFDDLHKNKEEEKNNDEMN